MKGVTESPNYRYRPGSFTKTLALALWVFFPLSFASAADGSGEARLSATLAELVGESGVAHFSGVIDPAAPIDWQVYIPPGSSTGEPYGLLVYISPVNSGRIPPSWKPVMDASRLIWIAANDSGNGIDPGLRISYAVLATRLAGREFAVDAGRVYVSGFSGGGRVASVVAPQYPQIFKGAIYNCGVNFWGGDTPPRMDLVRNNRYVFVTGSRDFNRMETRRALLSYRKVGVENVFLLDIDGMGHSNPRADKLTRAIEFLDRRVTDTGIAD